MKLKYDTSDPFGSLIHKMVADAYPAMVAGRGMLIDILSDTIFATKSTRFGPKPSPESQVEIRDYIASAIHRNEPLRFVVPWGSEKPDGSGPDLAELSAFKMLSCLDYRIQRHYAPGAEFSIRVEDASAPYLFFERAELAWHEADAYSQALRRMAGIIGDGKIFVALESDTVTVAQFNAEADKYLRIMGRYIAAIAGGEKDTEAENQLLSWGFNPTMSDEMFNFYLGQYEKMNPGQSRMRNLHILSRYMASVLARKKLRLNGIRQGWKDKMDLSFAGPVPGTESLFGKRVYYRTVPSTMTTAHMPPWRSKGYAAIDGETNSAAIKLASYNSLPSHLNPFKMTMEDSLGSVEVGADYIVAE